MRKPGLRQNCLAFRLPLALLVRVGRPCILPFNFTYVQVSFVIPYRLAAPAGVDGSRLLGVS